MRRLFWPHLLLPITAVLVLAFVFVALVFRPPESLPLPTPTPDYERPNDFAVGQCVRVTQASYLRFGPGLDYPVLTNIPPRSQPAIMIIAGPLIGLVCASSARCNPRDDGWWWPVQVIWPDNGDIDQGWLWQGEMTTCRSE